MKYLIVVLILVNHAFASDCKLGYQGFCDAGGKKYPNMCPREFKGKLKNKCLVNLKQSEDILEKCDQDIRSFCGDLGKFSEIFMCLSFPGHWSNMDRYCLKSLTQGLN